MRLRSGLWGWSYLRPLALAFTLALACCLVPTVALGAQTIRTIEVGSEPAAISSDGSHVWVTNGAEGEDSVSEIDASTGKLLRTIPVSSEPAGVSSNGVDVWVTLPEVGQANGFVVEIDASTGAVLNTIAVGKEPAGISANATDVWVTDSGEKRVTEIEISGAKGEPQVVHQLTVGSQPTGVSSDGGLVWVANTESDSVTEIAERPLDVQSAELKNGDTTIKVGSTAGLSVGDPVTAPNIPSGTTIAGFGASKEVELSAAATETVTEDVTFHLPPGEVRTVFVGKDPTGVSSDGTYVWVAASGENVVEQIEASSGNILHAISVGEAPVAVSSDGKHVWVTNLEEESLSEIEIPASPSDTPEVIETAAVGPVPDGVSSDGKHVWVADDGSGAVSEVAIPRVPVIKITAPSESVLYNENEVVAAHFQCTDGSEGPGLVPTGGCVGPVQPGEDFETGTEGEHSFTVTAKSEDGEVTTATAIYKVTGPPFVFINKPTEGATYPLNAKVVASFHCLPGEFAPALKTGTSGCEGPVADGSDIETSTPGEHTFTVIARSVAFETEEQTVHYDVAAAPIVSITSPGEGATYTRGEAVPAEFSCTDGPGGPGLRPGTEGCDGTVQSGEDINTAKGTELTFTVRAFSKDGQATETTVKYKVTSGPTVTVLSPTEGATYKKGQKVLADYFCEEGEGGPGLSSCTGTVADGTAIETASTGEHTFQVTAQSKDGKSAKRTIKYHVVAPPTVLIETPAEGAVYSRGAIERAAYSCTEGEGGTGLRPGAEGCKGTVEVGRDIETLGAREHVFRVVARSKDGEVTEKTVRYDVDAPPVVSISSPVQGATYPKGAKVPAFFSCHDGLGAPGLKPGTEGCSGTAAYGHAIETAVTGEHSFTVTATSKDGLVTHKTVTYKVH